MRESHLLLVSERRLFARSLGKILQVQSDGATVTHVQNLDQACAHLADTDCFMAFLDVVEPSTATQTHVNLILSAMQTLTAVQSTLGIVPVFDEQIDEDIETVMEAGATGVIVKSSPPAVLAEFVARLLDGQSCRPTPIQIVAADALTDDMRRRLSARQQKLLRLMIGGESISSAAEQLSITRSKVVVLMREINEIVRGKA